ncbi:TPA: hypothetical protein ACJYIT_001070, partial [Neisseria gonorrhoeae]
EKSVDARISSFEKSVDARFSSFENSVDAHGLAQSILKSMQFIGLSVSRLPLPLLPRSSCNIKPVPLNGAFYL